MKAPSVVFFPGAVRSVPVLRLSAVCLAGAAGVPQPAFEGGRGGGGRTGRDGCPGF